jgi:DNA repair protein RadC
MIVTYRGRTERGAAILNDADAARALREIPEMSGAVESFVVLLLNAKNKPIGWHLVAKGSVTCCAVVIADVFRPVIASGAARFMVAHNHPSGDSTPSPDDIAVTERLVQAARVLDLDLLDHVIVGVPTETDRGYTSFNAIGLMPRKDA